MTKREAISKVVLPTYQTNSQIREKSSEIFEQEGRDHQQNHDAGPGDKRALHLKFDVAQSLERVKPSSGETLAGDDHGYRDRGKISHRIVGFLTHQPFEINLVARDADDCDDQRVDHSDQIAERLFGYGRATAVRSRLAEPPSLRGMRIYSLITIQHDRATERRKGNCADFTRIEENGKNSCFRKT